MMRVQRAAERFHTKLEWLDSWHSFNFGRHYRDDRVSLGPLRVFNEDTVAPGAGFGSHAHSEMEIVSLVRGGALGHRDSTGGEGVLGRGQVQHMTAGTGVRHSEFNASDEDPVRFLQIWILPATPKLVPSYRQRDYTHELREDALTPVAAGRGHPTALPLHQDATIMIGELAAGAPIEHDLAAGRRAFLFVMDGWISTRSYQLGPGDSAAYEGEGAVAFETNGEAGVLLIDLP